MQLEPWSSTLVLIPSIVTTLISKALNLISINTLTMNAFCSSSIVYEMLDLSIDEIITLLEKTNFPWWNE